MKIVFIIIYFFSSSSVAQKIEIDQHTFAEYTLSKLKSRPENAQIISWGQTWIDSASLNETFLSELESFELNTVFGHSDRNYIIDLLKKVSEKASISQRQAIQRSICKWSTLNADLEKPDSRCQLRLVSLQTIKDRFLQSEFLVAEDMAIQLSSQNSFYIDVQSVYNWRILSSVYKSFSFRGSFADLQHQRFVPEKLIQGDCDSFTHTLDDIELISRGTVVFSNECRKNLSKPETSKARQWYERNKSWVIPVGIAALGAAAYHMKDKKIVINKPK